MVNFASAVPILPVSDLESAVSNYEELGFDVTPHEGGGYAFALRDEVAVHLGQVPETDPLSSQVAIYLYVDDADALASLWEDKPGKVVHPVDTEYGMREGAYLDEDGNLIRFGSQNQGVGNPDNGRKGEPNE